MHSTFDDNPPIFKGRSILFSKTERYPVAPSRPRKAKHPAQVGTSEDSQGALDSRFLNRDLSRLDFDERVLALSKDQRVPLLERVKFLAIFSSNLDEFFQIRVAGLKAQVESKLDVVSPDGLTPQAQLKMVHQRAQSLVRQATNHLQNRLIPELAEHGIRIVDYTDVKPEEAATLTKHFEQDIFPVLTPLAVDPAHPFPYISNLSLNLAVLLREPSDQSLRFARVKVPPLFPRLVAVGDERTFVPLESLIKSHLPLLFPGMEIASHSPFRITRDADLDVSEDSDEDLREALASSLRRQQRSSPAVRLEVDECAADEVVGLLMQELDLAISDVYFQPSPLNLADLWALYDLPLPELKAAVWRPRTPSAVGRKDDSSPSRPGWLFETLRDEEILLHHPYDSFSTTVEEFLVQAADDPEVLAIKHTLYRTSGPETSLFDALLRAADRGKQVVTLVELKARFDEQANLEWAQVLERAGVHVVYGLVGLKTHAKVTLVVRREGAHIRRYCHIGTGNYHPGTARLYEDLGLLTASHEIGEDVTHLFNHLTGTSRAPQFHKLLVAPQSLRARIIELIEREQSAKDGQIIIKVNNLSDPEIIQALYRASQAGVEIDLIVRGICCLRPGVPGQSERIRVRSILGGFLEHSRIYRFGSPKRGLDYLIGSADLMPRNLGRRVESLVPIEKSHLCEQLEDILKLNLMDDTHAWRLDAKGRWRGIRTTEGICAQEIFRARAVSRAESIGGETSG
ncbi:MAG: polyphosphate kinase 1 [bacterium TMED88]|nr:polyphosphate kinase 1 [Deltaproteobacteria bacterium]OUV33953.1 MAG: polyphosphate kinase 1 [bacterium TMED88]